MIVVPLETASGKLEHAAWQDALSQVTVTERRFYKECTFAGERSLPGLCSMKVAFSGESFSYCVFPQAARVLRAHMRSRLGREFPDPGRHILPALERPLPVPPLRASSGPGTPAAAEKLSDAGLPPLPPLHLARPTSGDDDDSADDTDEDAISRALDDADDAGINGGSAYWQCVARERGILPALHRDDDDGDDDASIGDTPGGGYRVTLPAAEEEAAEEGGEGPGDRVFCERTKRFWHPFAAVFRDPVQWERLAGRMVAYCEAWRLGDPLLWQAAVAADADAYEDPAKIAYYVARACGGGQAAAEASVRRVWHALGSVSAWVERGQCLAQGFVPPPAAPQPVEPALVAFLAKAHSLCDTWHTEQRQRDAGCLTRLHPVCELDGPPEPLGRIALSALQCAGGMRFHCIAPLTGGFGMLSVLGSVRAAIPWARDGRDWALLYDARSLQPVSLAFASRVDYNVVTWGQPLVAMATGGGGADRATALCAGLVRLLRDCDDPDDGEVYDERAKQAAATHRRLSLAPPLLACVLCVFGKLLGQADMPLIAQPDAAASRFCAAFASRDPARMLAALQHPADRQPAWRFSPCSARMRHTLAEAAFFLLGERATRGRQPDRRQPWPGACIALCPVPLLMGTVPHRTPLGARGLGEHERVFTETGVIRPLCDAPRGMLEIALCNYWAGTGL